VGQHGDGRVELLEAPAAGEHGDAVAEPHGLVDVVRHQHDRRADVSQDAGGLLLQVAAAPGPRPRTARPSGARAGRWPARGDPDALAFTARCG
jgi:hypothetical protein